MESLSLFKLILLVVLGFFLAVLIGDWNVLKYFGGTGSAILYLGIPVVALHIIKTLHMVHEKRK